MNRSPLPVTSTSQGGGRPQSQKEVDQGIKMLFRAHYEQDPFLIEAACRHLVLLDDLGFMKPDSLTPSGGRTE